MVKHHFHASSWPTNHPRFKHPVYGEVEKCNWNMECVKLWDANTAFFDALPEDERLKIIGIKETKDAKKAELAASPPKGAADQIPLVPIAIPAEDGSNQAEPVPDPVLGMPQQLGGEAALELGGGLAESEPMPPSEQLDLDLQQEQWMDQNADDINAQSEEPMGASSPELAPVSESRDHSATVDDPIAQELKVRGAEPEAAPIEEGLTPGLDL
jgi:hypothetical protein